MNENIGAIDALDFELKHANGSVEIPVYVSFKVRGWVELLHYRNGKLIYKDVGANLITSAGKAEIAGLIGEVTSGGFKYIAIGTGATAANVADTTLQTESSGSGADRALATNTRITTSVTNDTLQSELTFTFSGSFAVTEAGLLDAASTGVLGSRRVFSAVNVVSTDQLTVRWKWQIS